jgi:hypothetical protein
MWKIRLGPKSYPLHDAPDYFSDTSSELSDDLRDDRAASSRFASTSGAGSGLWAGFGGRDDASPSSDYEPSDSDGSLGSAAYSIEPLKHSVSSRLKDRQTAAVSVEAVYDLPPNTLFDLLADPAQHEHIFDAIEVGWPARAARVARAVVGCGGAAAQGW